MNYFSPLVNIVYCSSIMVLRRVVVDSSHPESQSQDPNNNDTMPPSTSHQPHPPATTTPTPQILPVPNPVPSYWLSQPSPHANLRSTPHLPETCTIAIIGSGMAGILTLYYILATSSAANKPLPHIVLLDARSLCSGATARNGGHAKIKTDTLTSLDGDVRRDFAAYVSSVMAALKELVDSEEGLAGECEFELRRSFDVFLDSKEAGGVKGVWDGCVRDQEVWTGERSFVGGGGSREEEGEGREGGTAEKVTSVNGAVAAWSSPCASFWPYKLVTGLLHRLVKRYDVDVLNVQMNTPVLHISSAADIPAGATRLHTSRGDILADKVVFATNAWTAGLLKEFEGTIVPVKGMASHHVPARVVYPHLNNTYNIHFPPVSSTADTLPPLEKQHQRHGTDYLNPRPDGSIVVGGGSYKFVDDPSSWHGNFNDAERFRKDVEEHWEGYMPETFKGWEGSGSRVDSVWVGIMGRTGNGMMHVGRVPGEEDEKRDRKEDGGKKKRQQWMLAGFNGGGMALIAVAAKAVAKMVLEDADFEQVRDEFGLLEGFGTGVERLKGEAKEN
ncbi:FAD dependent oxidoreductase-domain-containing protein [Paraphoma chrysanthemicola]|uniref:FAD dependent oxidoreductase-domain-containing protein n=1 Tax=Paraphoma chrysanthemicola TaxID=798071 RepID=A0A8K0R8R9_9PLEO|nr:FAD dependent oxidoreductase-domain-containing protein [Paraphoma chrysanthemicola]